VSINVLDGFLYILEARLRNESSNALEYRILFRGSPHYDKIGSLCELLMEYGEGKEEVNYDGE